MTTQNQVFYQASVETEESDFGYNLYRVYANRKDSTGIPATYCIGTFYSEIEAQKYADKINQDMVCTCFDTDKNPFNQDCEVHRNLT